MSEQQKIGQFIKSIREARGMTQEEFAKSLRTSQSAVARMESGNQNFTTQVLEKVSRVLGRRIIAMTDSIDFRIEGGKKLHGSIATNASKNGALGVLSAALLNRGKTVLHGIPRIEEVNRFVEVLDSIGFHVEWIDQNSVSIVPPKKIHMKGLNGASAGKIRSVLMLMGGLIHYEKAFRFPHAGGCKMGQRTIAAHRYGLEDLGVKIITHENEYEIKVGSLHGADITLYEASDTATENLLIAAARIPATTTISFATPNYQVQDVCFFLEKMGVRIEGIGTSNLTIHGVADINMPVEYHNSEDPIESMMFLSAAITTHSQLTVTRCPIEFIKL